MLGLAKEKNSFLNVYFINAVQIHTIEKNG